MSSYIIKSRLNGLVLEADNGGVAPGARVTPQQHHGRDSQIWYDDPSTGTIRCRTSQFCLDVESEHLCVRPFQPGDPNQQWVREGAFIRNRQDQNRVLDVFNNNRAPGAQIGVWAFSGSPNQSWEFDTVQGGYPPMSGGYPQGQTMGGGYPQGQPMGGGYPQGQPMGGGYPEGHHHHHHQGGGEFGGIPQQGGGYPNQGGYPPQGGGYPSQGGMYPSGGSVAPIFEKRQFYIVSELNGKVLDIERGSQSPGTKICIYDKHSSPKPNQLWYLNQQGFILSSLNDMAFTNTEQGRHLDMQPAGSNGPRSQWTLQGKMIANGAGEALDVKGNNHSNGAELISYKFNDQKNQHWRLEYV